MTFLKTFDNTGSIEVFHSLYSKYCPKRLILDDCNVIINNSGL